MRSQKKEQHIGKFPGFSFFLSHSKIVDGVFKNPGKIKRENSKTSHLIQFIWFIIKIDRLFKKQNSLYAQG